MNFRSILKQQIKNLGFSIQRVDQNALGTNINDDTITILKQIRADRKPLTLFDVGANIGQSTIFYKQHFPDSRIHAFEPAPKTIEQLKNNTKKWTGITYNQLALGSKTGMEVFYENEMSDISSFLESTEKMWGKVLSEQKLEIKTLDAYVKEHDVGKIDFLKIDTQGYDFEVLKGAFNAMQNGDISMIQTEITLVELYRNLPQMDEILKYLFAANFRLVAFYGFHNKNIAAQWTDCLFIHNSFVQ